MKKVTVIKVIDSDGNLFTKELIPSPIANWFCEDGPINTEMTHKIRQALLMVNNGGMMIVTQMWEDQDEPKQKEK